MKRGRKARAAANKRAVATSCPPVPGAEPPEHPAPHGTTPGARQSMKGVSIDAPKRLGTAAEQVNEAHSKVQEPSCCTCQEETYCPEEL